MILVSMLLAVLTISCKPTGESINANTCVDTVIVDTLTYVDTVSVDSIY